MKIKRIKIRNYRSIKYLEFQPSSVCALVGENGAGKSNILSALELLLGERWPQTNRLSKSDYFNHDESLQIFIGVEFEPNENGIRFISFDQREEKYQTRYWHFNAEKNNWNALSNAVKDKCALVYVGSERDLSKQLGYSQYSLLGKIIRQFDALFPPDTAEDLKTQFKGVEELLRTREFNLFEQEMTSAFSEQVRSVDDQLKLHFQAFDPLSFYRSLCLVLNRQEQIQDLSEVGQGMRNLALIALFRAYAKTLRGDAIIAIEEPEIYLHPHAQRSLATLFDELAERGNQIFYSTHSDKFLSVDKFDEVVIVRKSTDEEGDLCTCVKQVSAPEMAKHQYDINQKKVTEDQLRERFRNLSNKQHSEAFFARKIVLVEGDAEKEALPIYSQGLGYDFDKQGVSVVDAIGKDNLGRYYQLYSAFEIPVYMIFDNDIGKRDIQALETNKTLLRLLNQKEISNPPAIVATTYTIMHDNFEEQMKLAIGESEYERLCGEAKKMWNARGKGQYARHIAIQLVTSSRIPDFIREIVKAIEALEET